MKRHSLFNRPVMLAAILSFTPLLSNATTLQDAVSQAITQNPGIQSSLQRARIYDSRTRETRANYLPSVDLYAGIGEETTDSPYTRSLPGNPDSVNLNRRETSVVVKQLIFDGMTTPNLMAADKEQASAAHAQSRATIEGTVLDVTRVYLELMRRKKLLEIAQANLDAHMEIYQKIELRSQSGVGRKADLDQIEARVALAQSNLIAAQANLSNAQSDYLRVVGSLPPDSLVMPGSYADKIPADITAAQKYAQEHNPLILAANSSVKSYEETRDASKGVYYPQIDFVFQQSWNKNLDGTAGEYNDYSAMLRMKYNIFNGGGDSARSRIAAYQLYESKSQRDSVLHDVSNNLQIAWNSYEAIKTQIPFLEQHVTAAEKTQNAYNQQFNIGQRTLLDLLNAKNELFDASSSYESAKYNMLYQEYRILATLGDLTSALSTTGNAQE